MQKTGTATSHLHGGRCPPWLFAKMTELSATIVEGIVVEFGTAEVLHRFSDPVWFRSFGNVLGFDRQSSGLTTVVLEALKSGLQDKQGDLGLFVAGAKVGRTDKLAALKRLSRLEARAPRPPGAKKSGTLMPT